MEELIAQNDNIASGGVASTVITATVRIIWEVSATAVKHYPFDLSRFEASTGRCIIPLIQGLNQVAGDLATMSKKLFTHCLLYTSPSPRD